jgi:hypothetical protein
MADRVLSTRALNRALLARQLLLERSALPLTKGLERIGGLQTQYAPSAYIGLWSRLRDFRRSALTGALERRRAVQGTLMRMTIHVVSAGDYWPMVEAIRQPRREWWLGVQRHRIEGLDMDRVAAFLRRQLAGGPLRQAELVKRLEAEGFPRMAWSGAGLWLDLVRVPPSGTWDQRRADLYGLAEDWLGPSTASPDGGLDLLIGRYLGGFGPASVKDVAGWAGLAVRTVEPALRRMKLRRFRDEQGAELLDLPRAPLPDPDAPAPVRFLPTWDATLLVHARRTQIVPEEHRPRVFNVRTPHSVPTFVVDGQVAGTWRYEKERVRPSPFGRLSKHARQEVEEEAERLTAFHGDEGA